jgi:hypothetical protein
MELLIPSLVALLIAVAIAFFIVPKLAPTVVVTVGSILLAWAIYNHASRFGVTEYERATWMYNIKEYSGFFLIGVVILGGYGLFFMNKQDSAAAPAMPPLVAPAVGGGFATIGKTVSSRLGELMRKGRITV